MSMDSISSKKPCVSVIIACYNVEDYIGQCCRSLFSQTLEDLEFIFIDDCSPDNSIQIMQSILKEYPQRTTQVKIIKHKTNIGISKTREEGVKAASGEYIIHCDPDDWIELDMYEQLYTKGISEDADIVLCDFWYHYYNDPIPYNEIQRPGELTSRSLLASCLQYRHPFLGCFLWNKLIKSSHYQNVEWPQRISYCEDMIACVQILKTPSLKIGYVDKSFYHYRIKESSLSHRSFSKQDIENDYEIISILYTHLCKNGDKELFHIWQSCIAGFMIGPLESPERYLTNKEFSEKYWKYRNCIWKNLACSTNKKVILYCATYNYYIAYMLYKVGKRIKTSLRKYKSSAFK